MLVESFECQETKEENVEQSNEAIDLINQLSLTGQQKLICPKDDGKIRFPYRQIRRDEKFVYQTLCPNSTPLETFQDCPIPLRVLQIAAHAKSLDLLKRFDVWSAEGLIKDPVLIAYDATSTWQGNCYILARWGEELDSFVALSAKAVDIWRKSYIESLIMIKQKVECDLSSISKFGMNAAIKSNAPSYCGL
jgi:hypothetical protein